MSTGLRLGKKELDVNVVDVLQQSGPDTQVAEFFGYYRDKLLSTLEFQGVEPEMSLQEILMYFLSAAYPEFEKDQLASRISRYVSLLNEKGIHWGAVSSLELPDRTRISESMESVFLRFFLAIVPQNFLQDNVDAIRAINGARSVESNDRLPYLFHVTSDKAAVALVRKGGFSTSLRKEHEGIGTGPYEVHLGLEGVFCKPSFPYSPMEFGAITSDLLNCFVFGGRCLLESSVVSLNSDVGFGRMKEDLLVKDLSFDKLLPSNTSYSALDIEGKKAFLYRELVLYLCMVMLSVVEPQDLEGFSTSEVVLPHSLAKPSFLIVNDEPGYFYDENPTFFDDVVLLTDAAISTALNELGEDSSLPMDKKRGLFFKKIASDEINVEDYRYSPEE